MWKCHFTEMQIANSYTLDVEHLLSKGKIPGVEMIVWSNLFLAGPTQNSIKPKIALSQGYLDPCNPTMMLKKKSLYALSMHVREPGL